MTFLQAINEVLARLRESSVSAVNETEYSTLIQKFINDAKAEVEDSWDWTALRSQVQVTTSSGTQQYTLTGAGERYKVINVLDVTNSGILSKAPSQTWMDIQTDIGSTNAGSPTYYNFKGIDSNNDPYVDLYPIPNGTFTINFELVIPQAELSAASTVITVPWRPVVFSAYTRAVSERGEDRGASYTELDAMYQKELSNAISLDSARHPTATDWWV